MKAPRPIISKAEYFPIQKNWRKLKPLFESNKSYQLWFFNLKEYLEERGRQYGFKHVFDPKRYKLPRDFDSCDWRYNGNWRRGRQPAFWNYACHGACHWIVDMCLYVAKTAYPETPWRIISSTKHSTVWNGSIKQPILFDVNFLALGVSPREAIKSASKGRVWRVGQYLREPSKLLNP